MKRIANFIAVAEASIAAVETNDKKREQIEAAKVLAPKLLNGIWLTLGLTLLNVVESTIPA